MQIVLTGGPCVGKTTLIKILRANGFSVVDEAAARIIKTSPVPEPWLNRDKFQMDIMKLQQTSEQNAALIHGLTFLDRGVFDGAAYYLCDGMLVPPIFDLLHEPEYALTFLLEELPFFENDGVRHEDLKFTRKITPILERCYQYYGFKVIRVPSYTPLERFHFILNALELFIQQPMQRRLLSCYKKQAIPRDFFLRAIGIAA